MMRVADFHRRLGLTPTPKYIVILARAEASVIFSACAIAQEIAV